MRPVLFATAAIALTLTSALSQETPAAEESASQEKPSGPVVTIETSLGTITVELDDKKAPKSSKNFLHYVRTGFYEGTVFHRVIPEFMVQAGGYAQEPENELVEKETRPPVASEAKNGLSNLKGTIAMARKEDSANSATSQFFINTVDNVRLDPPSIDNVGYTVFGKITDGMEIVEKISAVPTTIRKVQTRLGNGSVFKVDLPNVPTEDVVIKKTVYVNDPTEPAPEPEVAEPEEPAVEDPAKSEETPSTDEKPEATEPEETVDQ
ncbi:peptidylprolyl isomerase [Verrucomicrobiales bacterium]|nr:peptidylprolyl isomerase [Verrucomicrobiales bacterium]